MEKRVNVIGFFVTLLVFALLLMFFTYVQYGKFTGFVISGDSLTERNNIMSQNEAFSAQLGEHYTKNNKFFINYSLEELGGENRIVGIYYEFNNSNGIRLTKGYDEVILGANNSQNYILSFELPKDSIGDLVLTVKFSNGYYSSSLSKKIYLSKEGMTGLVISDSSRQGIYFIASFLILSVIVIFIIKKIVYFSNLKKISSYKEGSIDLDLR